MNPFITAAHIYELHRGLGVGQSLSPSKPGCVEGAVNGAYTSALYSCEEGVDEPDLLHVAAFLFFYFAATHHCFVDGNKRIAWLALVEILATLELTLDVDDDTAEDFVLQLADGRVREHAAIVAWIAERLVGVE